jgi:hypothetical protein
MDAYEMLAEVHRKLKEVTAVITKIVTYFIRAFIDEATAVKTCLQSVCKFMKFFHITLKISRGSGSKEAGQTIIDAHLVPAVVAISN